MVLFVKWRKKTVLPKLLEKWTHLAAENLFGEKLNKKGLLLGILNKECIFAIDELRKSIHHICRKLQEYSYNKQNELWKEKLNSVWSIVICTNPRESSNR